jgi:hypothetical protein
MEHDSTILRYNPLSQNALEIRLLRIQPCSNSTENDNSIKCDLETISLKNQPQYTALSYTWGDQSVKFPISVNGKTVHVTENLNDALLRLRNSSPYLVLWIDAICINQQDEYEKSWQVNLMLQIYREAARVLVWLGLSADDSDFIMEGFQDFGQDAFTSGLPNLDGRELLDAANIVQKAVSAFNQFKTMVGQPGTFEEMIFRRFYGKNRCNFKKVFPPPSIEAFLRRAWWQRVWVLQEFSVARSVEFMCGDKVISADILQSALILIQLYNDAVMNEDSAVFAMERVFEGSFVGLENFVDDNRSMWTQEYNTENQHRLMFQQRRFYQNNKPISLLDLLEFASGVETDAPLQASDPRDIIFALLGLSADADALGIKPDYTKSIRQVYEEVAIAFVIERWRILSLGFDVDVEAVKRKEWASWVPDWRRVFSVRRHRRHSGIYQNHVTEFCAGTDIGEQNIELYLENKPPLMTMTCTLLDMVAEVKVLPLSKVEPRGHEPTLPLHDVSPAFIRSIQEVESFARNTKHILGYDVSDKDVVWRTLMGDRIVIDLTRRRTGVRLDENMRTEYRDAFQAIVENRVRQYVMDEQFAMLQKTIGDQQQERTPGGLENVNFMPLATTTTLSVFALTVKTMVAGRALIITKQGLLCLGPLETKPGHLIVVPHGMPTPIVLCPLGFSYGGELCGASTGEIYVHGVMDGEIRNLNLPQRVVNFC